MARGRAQLTDKQERIMVQSQLMGLGTSDMIKIANRMRALDTEREFKRTVDQYCADFTFEKKDYLHYVIKNQKGRVFECKGKRHWDRWAYRTDWSIEVTHPGTRLKPKVVKDVRLHENSDEIARACPNGEKVLYRLMKFINQRGL